jgi:hypothetical protein
MSCQHNSGSTRCYDSLTLPHDNTAHEDLDGSDALERDLALAGGLVQTQLAPELILADRLGVVDLVAENDEGDVGELLHAEERIELGLGLGKTLVVLGVDEEDDAADLGEVVAPQAAGLSVTAEIECCELDVTDRQLFGG